jgi:hypothetical protein
MLSSPDSPESSKNVSGTLGSWFVVKWIVWSLEISEVIGGTWWQNQAIHYYVVGVKGKFGKYSIWNTMTQRESAAQRRKY